MISENNKKNNCKGLIFRGRVNSYISGNNIITQNKTIRLLKRKSCEGCENCGWFFDSITEFLHNDPAILANVENGKLYHPVGDIDYDVRTGESELIGIYFEEEKI